MSNNTISVENLGPIAALEFALSSPGVTVLVAPNGSGKTIMLEAVQAAAVGKGKLPLRDRTRRGKVEAFGATITIGGTCRHTGAFEVTNLEGRFDLAGLVDPQIKAPALADKARIKALVSLTGVAASVDLFRNHEAFSDSFGKVVKATSVETDDLIEMAAKIKDDYDSAARGQEDAAERETGHATALIPPQDLDLQDDSDPKILQAAYDESRDELTRLISQAESAGKMKASHDQAQAMLEGLAVDELTAERETLAQSVLDACAEFSQNENAIAELKAQIHELQTRMNILHEQVTVSNAKIATIGRQLEIVAQAQAVLASASIEAPTADEIHSAKDAVEFARAAVERGTLIRQAIKDQSKASSHRKAASAARALAATYRDAGKATDEVLSSCIKCPQLRVESDGKSARLVTDTERGPSIPYHDLSDGEKWTIAIDIGADQVGEGGLLVISQIGWEGIDGANRQEIHHHAVSRGVYILTAEASSDPEAAHEIVPTRLPDVEPKPKAKPEPVAPVEKPVAKPPAKPKAKPIPTPVFDEDSEDIPF